MTERFLKIILKADIYADHGIVIIPICIDQSGIIRWRRVRHDGKARFNEQRNPGGNLQIGLQTG